MKRKHLFLLLVAMLSCIAQAQEKKPTLMIVPSDNWCTQRYFTTTYDNQGAKVRVPDYQRAFQEDLEIKPVIARIGQLMTDMGYSLKDCEQELKAITTRQAEDNVTLSKTSGASLVESPLDQLKRRTKSDIIINVDWVIRKETAGRTITFTLEAFDSYTSKRIATATGTCQPSDLSVPELLECAVSSHIKTFDKQLDNYFRDLKKHGREIVLTVRCWDSWDKDLEEEYNGEELTDCIQQWLREHTVDGVFNLSDDSETFLQFEQVRIPFYDEKGNAMDARAFATQLRKHLAKEPYNITAKVIVRGLGEALLILGEK